MGAKQRLLAGLVIMLVIGLGGGFGVRTLAAGMPVAEASTNDRVFVDRSLRVSLLRGSAKLQRKARFQMGNAEFRLGLAAGTNNLDDTISHWKQSLDHYNSVLKESPADFALFSAWVAGVNKRIDEVAAGAQPLPYCPR